MQVPLHWPTWRPSLWSGVLLAERRAEFCLDASRMRSPPLMRQAGPLHQEIRSRPAGAAEVGVERDRAVDERRRAVQLAGDGLDGGLREM